VTRQPPRRFRWPRPAPRRPPTPHHFFKIVGAATPAKAGFENAFDGIERRRIECGQPKDSLRLSGDWKKGAWGASARTARYGEFCSFTLGTASQPDQTFEAKWLTDLEVTYQQEHYTLALGAQNVFNTLPDRNITLNSFSGIQTFPSQSPFGMNGRFLYGRVTVRF
jgi:iron complex outermembrane receptor protein